MIKLNNPFSFVNMRGNKWSKICISKSGKSPSSAKQKKQINVDGVNLLGRLIPRSDPYHGWIGLTSLICRFTSRAVFLGQPLPKLKGYQWHCLFLFNHSSESSSLRSQESLQEILKIPFLQSGNAERFLLFLLECELNWWLVVEYVLDIIV